jgi:hypothetical protein
MRFVVVVASMAFLALGGCAGINQPTQEILAAPKRDLTDAEKAALTPVLSRTLKDPGAAQYKWMPVVLTERNGITDYCGLVNGKNSYGGYTGFTGFYAQLIKDSNGQFTSGVLRAIEDPNRETNPLDPRWLNGICEKFGYIDFGAAR